MIHGPKVSEHHCRRENHRSWVGTILSHDVLSHVTTSGLKERIFLCMEKSMSRDHEDFWSSAYTTDVAARDYTRTTDEGSTNVRHNSAVQIRHDHDIELCGF